MNEYEARTVTLNRSTLAWGVLWLSLGSLVFGAAVTRSYLNSAHARQLAANDRACLRSVFLATVKRKTPPAPKLLYEGHTKKQK